MNCRPFQYYNSGYDDYPCNNVLAFNRRRGPSRHMGLYDFDPYYYESPFRRPMTDHFIRAPHAHRFPFPHYDEMGHDPYQPYDYGLRECEMRRPFRGCKGGPGYWNYNNYGPTSYGMNVERSQHNPYYPPNRGPQLSEYPIPQRAPEMRYRPPYQQHPSDMHYDKRPLPMSMGPSRPHSNNMQGRYSPGRPMNDNRRRDMNYDAPMQQQLSFMRPRSYRTQVIDQTRSPKRNISRDTRRTLGYSNRNFPAGYLKWTTGQRGMSQKMGRMRKPMYRSSTQYGDQRY